MDLTILKTSSISSFEKTCVFIPDPKIFFWIAPSVADAAPIDPKHTKILLDNGVSTFTLMVNQLSLMV